MVARGPNIVGFEVSLRICALKRLGLFLALCPLALSFGGGILLIHNLHPPPPKVPTVSLSGDSAVSFSILTLGSTFLATRHAHQWSDETMAPRVIRTLKEEAGLSQVTYVHPLDKPQKGLHFHILIDGSELKATDFK